MEVNGQFVELTPKDTAQLAASYSTTDADRMILSTVEAAMIRELREATRELELQARGALALMLRTRGLPPDKRYSVSDDGSRLIEKVEQS